MELSKKRLAWTLTLASFIAILFSEARHIPVDAQLGSRDRLLTNHGLSSAELAVIKTRLQELKELWRNMTLSDRTWLDNTLPNLEQDGDLFDGCSWMTSEQIDHVILVVRNRMEKHRPEVEERKEDAGSVGYTTDGPADEPRSRKRRNIEDFSKMPSRKWPNPILYKFDGSHSEEEQATIRAAIRHWQTHTCIRFFEVNREALIPFNHLVFTSSFYGCMSYVGQTDSQYQLLNLHSVCLKKFGIPVHEIGHALGLWHEHQRWDRDDHVRIVEQNIAAYHSQFWKHETETYDLPYDYGSVMHYAPKSGSITGSPTIETKDPLFQRSLGQRTGLSFYDAKTVNMAYCSEICPTPLAQGCTRGGYQDPTDCTRCRCIPGLGGEYCQTVAPSSEGCGGVVMVTEEGTTLSSPGYDADGFYHDRMECNWLIKAPPQHRILLVFEGDFGVYCDTQNTCYHWVEVNYKRDLSLPGPRFCCYDRPTAALLSEDQEMLVTFRANFTTYWRAVRRGFKVTLRAERIVKVEDKEINIKEDNILEVEDFAGTSWSSWGRCQNSECKCGGCSVTSRHRMCGDKRCSGRMLKTETKACDNICTKTDRFLNLSGNIIEMPCPICCEGFLPNGERCVPKTSS